MRPCRMRAVRVTVVDYVYVGCLRSLRLEGHHFQVPAFGAVVAMMKKMTMDPHRSQVLTSVAAPTAALITVSTPVLASTTHY